MGKRRGKGHKCTYCRRTMMASTDRSRLAATRDHVIPDCKGGTHTVWACRACNELKRDMDPYDWTLFMATFPDWWRLTVTDLRKLAWKG